MNLGGSHDQTQIQAEGCDPLNRRKTGKSRAQSAHVLSKPATGPSTKHARIIAMLRTPAGTTIASLVTATEWQQHSVRGFLAGVVRKKLGLNLVSEQTTRGEYIASRTEKFRLPLRTGLNRRPDAMRGNVAMVMPRPKYLSSTRSRTCAISISKDYGRTGRAYFQRPAPTHITRHLLFSVIAYRLQADRFGDLDHETKQVLDRTVC